MSLSVHSYETSESVAWDALVDESRNGTFLHTRRFLSYHGDRFNDASLVIRDKKQRLIGVFPAAIDPGVSDRIVSHPGITYGGIVHNGSLRGERMVEALAAICAAYRNAGMRTLQYKVVPYIYHRFPSEDELYALFRLGAHRCRCELSSTLDLENRLPFAREKRQSIRQAERNDLSVEEGSHLLAPLWTVVAECLAQRHQAAPVHSLSEIQWLQSAFPTNIRCVVAKYSGEVVGGIVIFRSDRVDHGQYSACSPEGLALRAAPLLIDRCIAEAENAGVRYFDLGTSNECEGMVLNESLHKFKSDFGAGGVAYERYELPLN